MNLKKKLKKYMGKEENKKQKISLITTQIIGVNQRLFFKADKPSIQFLNLENGD